MDREIGHIFSILHSCIHGVLSSSQAACKINTVQYLEVTLREEVCLVGVRATPVFDRQRFNLKKLNHMEAKILDSQIGVFSVENLDDNGNISG
jgi:hypothetical protein